MEYPLKENERRRVQRILNEIESLNRTLRELLDFFAEGYGLSDKQVTFDAQRMALIVKEAEDGASQAG